MCKMKCDLSEIDLKIIAVSNRKLCERPFLEQIERVCQVKPQAIILREKDLSEEEYRILSEEVLSVCKKHEIPCILHKFWKTALELECTSVHLPLPELRKLPEGVKEQFQRIGTSVHSVEDAKEAERLGVSYMTAGHIYVTDCKKGLAPRGLGFLKDVCSTVNVPVYAIGGIKFDEKQWYDVINGCKELENVIHEQRRLIDAGLETLPKPEGPFQAAPRKCELIVGEWGNWHSSAFNARPALYQQCTMRDAVTTALTLDIFHRNTGDVRMACVAQSVNVLNSLFLTDGEHCILTPNYDVFDMYQVHQGAYTLGFEEKNKDPEVCIFASIKNDDIYINLVNTSYSESKKIELKFKQCPEFVEAKTLYSKDPQNYNDAKHPNRVRCKEGKAPAREKDSFQIALPAASVSVYHFRKTETEK